MLPTEDDIHVLDYVEGLHPSLDALQASPAELVIVACSPDSREAVTLIEQAVGQRPDRPVVVLQMGAAESNGFMHEVFGAGADDIVSVSESPERVRHTLQKTIARRRGAALAKGGAPARLICVLGPKGGTGKTVTTCNVGVALAERARPRRSSISIFTSATSVSDFDCRPSRRSSTSRARPARWMPRRSTAS